MLPEFDIAGQQKLLESTALIIGMGGLGSPVAMYLAAAGVGHLILVDFDVVELTNLQRQIIHHTSDLGRLKVESARDTLLALNPEAKITCIPKRLDDHGLAEQVKQADVVSNKRLGSVLEQCREHQAVNRIKRSKKAPARHAQLEQIKERALNPAVSSYDP